MVNVRPYFFDERLFSGFIGNHTAPAMHTNHIAGINHQSWLLNVRQDGTDLYPEIKRRAACRNKKHGDMVRYEIMKQFGYYVTESSLHSAEYMPYFMKNRYEEHLDEYGIKTDMYLKWEQERIDYWKALRENLIDNKELTHEKTREFASHIINAALTGQKSYLYQAAMLDPHAASELSIRDIRCMCDELLEASADWIDLRD